MSTNPPASILDGLEHTVQLHISGQSIAHADVPPPIAPLVASVAPARPEPPPGIYLQIYRGAIRGATTEAKRAVLLGYMDRIQAMSARVPAGSLASLPGSVLHGFPQELVSNFDRMALAANARGLLALAAWGLDGKADNDGSVLTAREKGRACADVLKRPACAAGLLDMEGQWDTDLGPADDMDEAGARDLGAEILSGAPGAWVGDQLWYAIDSHGDVRTTVRPLDNGGVFRGFPVDEIAPVCRWGRYRQAYLYNAMGAGYASTFARMDREWAIVQPALARAGLAQPLRVTLQGYRWKLHEMVHALLDRHVRPAEAIVIWCDPWPDAVCLRAIAMVQFLVRAGFAGRGVDAREAVRAFQREFNKTAPVAKKLTEDGWAGAGTCGAAGVV